MDNTHFGLFTILQIKDAETHNNMPYNCLFVPQMRYTFPRQSRSCITRVVRVDATSCRFRP